MTTLAQVAALVRERTGLDPEVGGPGALGHAVRARVRTLGLATTAAYLELLRADARERDALAEILVVQETWFFRDREPFVLLAEHVTRARTKDRAEPVALLSLPCATGEEPWSMAIALAAAGLAPAHFRIDAIDVSEQALAVARAGVYRARSLRGHAIDAAWQRWLQRRPDATIEVAHELRPSVVFSRGSLLEIRTLAAGRRYQAIFSRNLLMYLEEPARRDACAAFLDLLLPGGLLVLGHAETLPVGTSGLAREGVPGAFAWRRRDAEVPRGAENSR